jgi:hypothetical protein
LFERLSDLADCAEIQLSELGHLRHVGVNRPLGVLRLDLDDVSEIPRLKELLPRLQRSMMGQLITCKGIINKIEKRAKIECWLSAMKRWRTNAF